MGDGLLVPLPGPARWTLATPAHLPEDLPHVARMVRTAVSSSMSAVTRSVVQSSVSYPNAPGPRFSARSMRFNSLGPSRGFRPARARVLEGGLASLGQHLRPPVYRLPVGPHSSSDLGFDTPCASSFAALSRRRSSARKSRFIPAGCPMPTNIHCMGQNVTILCDSQ